MKKISITFMILFLVGLVHSQSVNCPKAGIFLPSMPECNGSYYLAFEDNFDGNSLDLSKWQICPSDQGALYSDPDCLRQEYNTLDNVEVSNGTCKIFAKQETVVRRAVSYKPDNQILEDGLPNLRTYNFTSASLWSINESFLYGKYEIRCRLPSGSGFWPAFWTFGGASGRWNELDIIDNLDGGDTYSCGPGHDFDGGGTSEGCRYSRNNVADFTQWHTFTCTYDFDRIVWEIDGVIERVLFRFSTVSGTPIVCGEDIAIGTYFQEKSFPVEYMHLIFNLAVRNGNEAPTSPSLPGIFEVDYIRFFVKSENQPCEGCVDHIVYDFTNQLPELTRAENYILAGDNVTIENGQDVTFKSPDIILNPGFAVDQGATFAAIAQECGISNLEDVPINFLGSNAIDNYRIDKCSNPFYSVHVTGAYAYFVQISNALGQVVYSGSGNPQSNHLFLWDAINAADGWYQVHLELTNCMHGDIRDYNVLVESPGCRLLNADTSGASYSGPLVPPDNGVLIYPNPTNTILNLAIANDGDRPVAIIICDINGREILRENNPKFGLAPHEVDVSILTNGVYILTCAYFDRSSQQRFVISE